MKKRIKEYEVVVVGGGLSGVCAAIAVARNGSRTALIQNRSVLGGNASSEVRVNINGALRNAAEFKENVGEGGILMEILLANKVRNPQHSFHILDNIIWEKVNFEKNLDLYLNTSFFQAEVKNNRIEAITALQITTETLYEFKAQYYIDTTGDASVASESGAFWTSGREARATYHEEHAPEIADYHTMGSTIMFSTKDMGHPVTFIKPDWAYEFTKEKLGNRSIYDLGFGYWWTEVGGDDLNVIDDAETISEELKKWVFGIFDYIKNSGNFKAENLALDWIASVPGRRESRRIIGDYVLCEEDCAQGRRFEDAIAYGGWSMDDHSVGGIRAMGKEEIGTRYIHLKDIYTIPYRCIYSKNITNLFVGGRSISVSHMAMSSTRVMATCAIIGQAAGTAAALCVTQNCSPRDLGKEYINKLQQTLIKQDCYLPGIVTDDATDLCTSDECSIVTSSFIEGADTAKLTNGHRRNIDGVNHAWISDGINDTGEFIEIVFKEEKKLKEVHIAFDPDYNMVLITTPMQSIRNRQPKDLAEVMVKDFKIEAFLKEDVIYEKCIVDNIKCHCVFDLYNTGVCDRIKITITKTYGCVNAKVYEVRVY